MFTKVQYLVAAALCAALLAVTGTAGASDIFLKLAFIPGDSTNEQHKDEIDVLSFSLGFSNPTVVGRGGMAGQCGEMVLTKNIDRASPRLLAAIMTSRFISSGVLSFTAPGATGLQDYYVLNMNEIHVAGIRQSDSAGSGRVMEQVTLLSRTYEFVYRAQQPTGEFVEHKFGWDCTRNSPL